MGSCWEKYTTKKIHERGVQEVCEDIREWLHYHDSHLLDGSLELKSNKGVISFLGATIWDRANDDRCVRPDGKMECLLQHCQSKVEVQLGLISHMYRSIGDCERISMRYEHMHGVVTLPTRLFDKLNKKYFLDDSTKDVVHMCANPEEMKHLIALGVDIITCDWFTIKRGELT